MFFFRFKDLGLDSTANAGIRPLLLLIREIAQDFKSDVRFQALALETIQAAVESFLKQRHWRVYFDDSRKSISNPTACSENTKWIRIPFVNILFFCSIIIQAYKIRFVLLQEG